LRYYGLNTPPEDSDEIRSAVVSESAKFAPLQTREHYRLCAIDRHLVIDFYSGPAP